MSFEKNKKNKKRNKKKGAVSKTNTSFLRLVTLSENICHCQRAQSQEEVKSLRKNIQTAWQNAKCDLSVRIASFRKKMAAGRYVKNGGYRQWRTQWWIKEYKIALVHFQQSFMVLSIESDTFVQTCFIAHSLRNIFSFSYIREEQKRENKRRIERGSNRFIKQCPLILLIRVIIE